MSDEDGKIGRFLAQDSVVEFAIAESNAQMRRKKPIPDDAKLTTLVDRLSERRFPTQEEVYENSRAFHLGKQAARFDHDRNIVESRHSELVESYIQYAPADWHDTLRNRFYSEAEGLRFGRLQSKLDNFAQHIAKLRLNAIKQGLPVPDWQQMRHPKSGKIMTAPPYIISSEEEKLCDAEDRRKAPRKARNPYDLDR